MAATQTTKDNQVVPGSLLTSGSSNYEVQSFLGQGSFGKVVKCKRLDDNKTVAIKMIELKACNVKVANQEVAALKKVRSLDTFYIVEWFQFFADRGHICLEFEHLDKSLHGFMRERRFRPLPLMEIRPIVQQIAHALNHLKAAGIVHADLKMENVMLVDQLQEPFRVKLIDFGLAFEVSAAKLGSRIQTRHYRSPEIMLGHRFTEAIDMWSLGCVAAAMYLGSLLYSGCGEYEMIKCIMETQGQLPDAMLNHGCKTPLFFKRTVNSTSSVWKFKTPEEYHEETGREPDENRRWKITSLDDLLHSRPISHQNYEDKDAEMADAHIFVDMLKAMLQLDPDNRITPRQVLEHKFISMRHIARMDHKSHYVRFCSQIMQMCQKKIKTSGSGTPVCGPLKPPRSPATKSIMKNPPSFAEGRRTGQPRHTDLHPSTTTTQTRGTEGSKKRKIHHEELSPHKKNLPSSSNSRHDHHYNHKTGPSGRSRAEGQGEKRKRDHDDVRPQRKTCLPSSNRPADQRHKTGHSGSNRAEGQGEKRKRDHDDVWPKKKTCLPSSNRPADQHHKTGHSGSSRAEGRGEKRKRDHDDVRPPKETCLPSSSSRHDPRHTRHHLSAQRTRTYERRNNHH